LRANAKLAFFITVVGCERVILLPTSTIRLQRFTGVEKPEKKGARGRAAFLLPRI
jgi:hypothetical protein